MYGRRGGPRARKIGPAREGVLFRDLQPPAPDFKEEEDWCAMPEPGRDAPTATSGRRVGNAERGAQPR